MATTWPQSPPRSLITPPACVKERDAPIAVWFNDKQLPADMSFAESGIGVMDYIEAGYVE